jgi:hypothetical protein
VHTLTTKNIKQLKRVSFLFISEALLTIALLLLPRRLVLRLKFLQFYRAIKDRVESVLESGVVSGVIWSCSDYRAVVLVFRGLVRL